MEETVNESGTDLVRRSTRARAPVDHFSNNNRHQQLDASANNNKKRVAGNSKSSSKKKKAKPSPAGSRKQPKRKSAPQFLEDGNGEMVWLATVNVQDIEKARKTGKHPFGHGKKRQYLHTVNSPTQRQLSYQRAERALADIETCLLPQYGGRPWKVQVAISDPLVVANAKSGVKRAESPYFIFHARTGALELAAWPHILLKIPSPPRFPGYYVNAAEQKKQAAQKKKRKKQQQKQQQEGAAEAKVEGHETVSVSEVAQQAEKAPESDDEDDDDEEEVFDEEWLEILDLQERDVTSISELAYQERWRVPLPNISIKWISPLREIFTTRKSAWDHAVVLCKQDVQLDRALHGYDMLRDRELPVHSVKPLSRKKALEVGLIRFQRDGLWVVGQEEMWKQKRLEEEENDGEQKEVAAVVPKPLSGMQYYLQCHRVDLQTKRRDEHEEEMKLQHQKPPVSPDKDDAEAATPETPVVSKPRKFTLKDADNELKKVWKTLEVEEQEAWKQRSIKFFEKQHNVKLRKVASGGNQPIVSDVIEEIDPSTHPMYKRPVTPSSSSASAASHGEDSSRASSASPTISTPALSSPAPSSPVVAVSSSVNSAPSSAVTVSPAKVNQDLLDQKPPPAAKSTSAVIISPGPTLKAKTALAPAKKAVAEKPAPWTKWCLNGEQVKQCYAAGMDHYDTVIAAVKARDLHRELQDGFDVLRERGRGRFDMELPVFETPEFNFLTSLTEAPWMPVVRQILGKEVVLIHKGMFLSMPGAETQPYHQDGLHLTTQTQREAHAINVFIPLVDLTMKHGPTQFCLGTHILDQEEHDPEFIYTPLVSAGTPVIFDYRLGHFGMANHSGVCRPIVYCTYAPVAKGNKEFRDKINFSRSRYHRIGDLECSLLDSTREERSKKRQRVVEIQNLEQEQAAMQQALDASVAVGGQGQAQSSADP